MPSHFRCSELSVSILQSPVPLLFLDTAALLDLLRARFRGDVQSDVVDSAIRILAGALDEPRRVWPVTSSNVVIELEEHRQDVTAELDSSIRGMSSSIARMIEVARVLFPERAFAPFEFAPNGFQDPVSMVLDRLVDATAVCQHTDACTLKAANRVRSGLPPSKPGKQEFKDCEIFECFLELSAELRASGFEPAIVFVSPNKNDYGPPPDGFAAIANEIRSVNASYVANLSWARALLAGY